MNDPIEEALREFERVTARDSHNAWSELGRQLLNGIKGAVKSARDSHPEITEGYATSIVQRVHGQVMTILSQTREGHKTHLGARNDARARVLALVAELREDARRLDWLEDAEQVDVKFEREDERLLWWGGVGNTLREAIDAARVPGPEPVPKP